MPSHCGVKEREHSSAHASINNEKKNYSKGDTGSVFFISYQSAAKKLTTQVFKTEIRSNLLYKILILINKVENTKIKCRLM